MDMDFLTQLVLADTDDSHTRLGGAVHLSECPQDWRCCHALHRRKMEGVKGGMFCLLTANEHPETMLNKTSALSQQQNRGGGSGDQRGEEEKEKMREPRRKEKEDRWKDERKKDNQRR